MGPTHIQHAQATASSGDTLLGRRAQRALELEVVDTLADGLAEGGTLGDGLLAVAAADADAVDDVALLGLCEQREMSP